MNDEEPVLDAIVHGLVPMVSPRKRAHEVLYQLKAHGFVIVQCPPGEVRVIDRRPQPCPDCTYLGERMDRLGCTTCGGRGTVDADRVHGLKQVNAEYARYHSWDRPPMPMFRLVDAGDTEGAPQ